MDRWFSTLVVAFHQGVLDLNVISCNVRALLTRPLDLLDIIEKLVLKVVQCLNGIRRILMVFSK